MNGKRILAAVLAAAMTASSFTIDAFADSITPHTDITDNSAKNTVATYTTDDNTDNSVLAGSTIVNCASLDELQSEHPYAENSDITYVYTDTNCNNLKITFSLDTYFGLGNTYLTIYDGDDNQVDTSRSHDLAGISVYVPGNTVKLRFRSDNSMSYYGFKVASVENADKMPTQGDPEYDYVLELFGTNTENPVYSIKKYKGAGGDIVIPSEIDGRKVISIGGAAFTDCTTDINVTVSDGISDLTGGAFGNCSALKSISLPKSITTINNSTFHCCKNLTDVTLSDEVTLIGSNAFEGCSSLTDITIPDSVTEISHNAFYSCTSLKTVTVPESVSTIGDYAFGYYSDKDDDTSENKIIDDFKINYTKNTAAHKYAFENGFTDETCLVTELQDDGTVKITQYCGNDTSLVIPAEINGKKVTAIGANAFRFCPSLTSITIPDGVTEIGSNAFDGCASLTDVIMPVGLKSIYSKAFYNCTVLTGVDLPDSLTYIGYQAFAGCSSLESIVIPDSVTAIDFHAFLNCTSLKTVTVPASVISIGEYALGYYDDDSEKKKTDGFKINYIKNTKGHLYAFENGFTDEACLLYNILDDGTVQISQYVGNDTVYVIPEEIDSKKVTSIRSEAFRNCTLLTSITIPDSVTDIGAYAFSGCTSLSDITLSDSLTTIEMSAFRNCTSLTSITIPDSVTVIEGFVFEGCSSLSDITLPDSLTKIGYSAFQSCTSLTDIALPDSLRSISSYAFMNCTSLKTVTVPASVTFIDLFAFGYYFKDDDENYNNKGKIDDFTINYTKYTAGHRYAVENGFTDESCLDYIVYADDTVGITKYVGNDTVYEIPAEIDGKKVTEIGYTAFKDCTLLTSVTIPDGVTSISGYAFYNCTSLKTITVPASVTIIGSYAFGYFNDSNIETKIDDFKINYTKNTAAHRYAFENGFTDETCLVAELQNDGTVKITKYYGYDTVFEIPAEIDGNTVTSIGYNAFWDCTSLTSITIPDGVTEIGSDAFYDCVSLTDIVLPDSLITIGMGAFRNCTMLTSITIPDSVTVIGERAFANCTLLKSVTIPAGVTDIGEYAFGYYYDENYSHTKIDGFKINYTKNTQGHLYATQNGFSYETCLLTEPYGDGTSLRITRYAGNDTEYVIPAEIDGMKITEIGYNAFQDCTSLTSVTIPDGVTVINSGAFWGCTALTNVVLPDSITDISINAFQNCTSLKSVTIPASTRNISNFAFGYYYDDGTNKKIDGFKINYTKNSWGHLYATENGFSDEPCLIAELNEDGTTLHISKYAGNDTTLVIPAEIDGKKVTSIRNSAFDGNKSLTSITLPDGITSIGAFAFGACRALTDIVLPDSLTDIEIYAFDSCTSLRSVTIPAGVEYIGRYAFLTCTSLKEITIPASVTDIGEYAFGYYYDDNYSYTKIDGFKINYTKDTAGHYYAFEYGATDETCLLTELKENGTLRITGYAGYDTEYVIPAEINGKKVTEIGRAAFVECTSLTKVTIPDGVTNIGVEAFNLCTSLTDIVLPDSVTDIGFSAFDNCTSLKSVTIPAGVTNIGDYAFGFYYDKNEYGAKRVDGFKINYTKNTWGHWYATENGFSDETCLITYVIEDSDTSAIVGTLAIDKYAGYDKTYVIPSEIGGKKVTQIGNFAFENRTSLTSVTIPDGVTLIGSDAFAGCTALTDINIPDSVTVIEGYAFDGCSALADIKIPDSVTAIGRGAFNNTAILNNQDSNTKYVDKWLVYCDPGATSASIKADTVGIANIAFYDCKIQNIVIPDKIKHIGNSAFESCTSLTSVVIPDSVITIGCYAFVSCDSLKSVSIPASVASIGIYAFGFGDYNEKNDDFKIEYVKQTEGHRYAADNGFTDEICYLTEELDNGSLRVIGYAGKASSITIPAEINGKPVTELGNEEFRFNFNYHSALKSLTVPDSVIKINYKAFISSKLTTVVLPEKLTDIGIGAFAVTPVIGKQKTDIKYIGSTVISCDTEAETLTIGDNVTTIASNAFVNGDNYDGASNCGDLKSLIISRNVKYIGEHAFGYYLDEENNYRKVEDFTIKCYCNSAAEQYAKDNGIAYELIANGHNVVIDNAVEPTCTKTGLTEGSHCSICGATLIAQKTIPAKGHNYVDTVVKPTYTAQGYTLHKCSACGASYKDTYTAKLTLAKISGVKLGGRAADALHIGWTKNASADGYIVEMYRNGNWVRVAKITSNSTTAFRKSELSASTVYKFRVKAYKMEGATAVYSEYSTELVARTNPSAMTGVTLGGRAADALRINWNKNASADGYIVEMYKDGKWVRAAKITSNSTTTFRKAGLSASTVYKFRVQAYKMSGSTALYSVYSATVTARTNPSAMTGVTLGGRAADALRINWNKNASADGYIVEMYKDGKWVRAAKITSNSTTTFRKAGLSASTVYKFRVQAYKMSGSTALYSVYSATVTARTNPYVMTGVKIGGTAKDALRVNWVKNASAQGYIVEMYQGGKWIRVAKITSNAATTFRKAGLAKSTTYKFRVCAYYMSGNTALYGNYGSVSGKTAAR